MTTVSILTLTAENTLTINNEYTTPAIVKDTAAKTFENALNSELQRRYNSILEVRIDKAERTITRLESDKAEAIKDGAEFSATKALNLETAKKTVEDCKKALEDLRGYNYNVDITAGEQKIIEVYAHLITPYTGIDKSGKTKKLTIADVYYNGASIEEIIKQLRENITEYVTNGKGFVPGNILDKFMDLSKIIYVEDSAIFKKYSINKRYAARYIRQLFTVCGELYKNDNGKIGKKDAVKFIDLQHTVVCMLFNESPAEIAATK